MFLKELLDCIKKFELDYFVRICADRPLFDISVMNKNDKSNIEK